MTTLSRLLLVLLFLASCQPAPPSASDNSTTDEVDTVEESTIPATNSATTTAENDSNDHAEVSATEETSSDAAPTNTPRPIAGGLETTIYANARSCPWLTCPVLASFAEGASLGSGQLVEGGRLEGNKGWWRITHEGQVMYIHDSLVRQR